VKRTQVLATLLAACSLVMSGCGTSDSIKSVLLTSTGTSSGNFFNLVGADGTLQLKVYAVYNSGKRIDETNKATWNVTTVGTDDNRTPLPAYGPSTVPINLTGLMTAIVPLCTWTDLPDPKTGLPQTPPVWAYTGYYQVTATYRGFTSQPVAIGVGWLTSNSPTGGCGPS
jgi:hypothetical protein